MSGATNLDIIFSGTDGNECEAFIAAVRGIAFERGQDEDDRWMLRFATSRLRGGALRWHAQLDSSFRKDWDLFVQALFTQYPSVNSTDTPEPTAPLRSSITFDPGPQPSELPQISENQTFEEGDSHQQGTTLGSQYVQQALNTSNGLCQHFPEARRFDPSSHLQQIGLLRVVNDPSISPPQYVWWGYYPNERPNSQEKVYHADRKTTINCHEALVVSFLPSTEPHMIGCLNCRAHKESLAVRYAPETTVRSYQVVSSNCGVLVPSIETMETACMTKIWNVLEDGTLQVSLSSFDSATNNRKIDFTATEVHLDASGRRIRFVKQGTALEQDQPQSTSTFPFVRARIVFEPL